MTLSEQIRTCHMPVPKHLYGDKCTGVQSIMLQNIWNPAELNSAYLNAHLIFGNCYVISLLRDARVSWVNFRCQNVFSINIISFVGLSTNFPSVLLISSLPKFLSTHGILPPSRIKGLPKTSYQSVMSVRSKFLFTGFRAKIWSTIWSTFIQNILTHVKY